MLDTVALQAFYSLKTVKLEIVSLSLIFFKKIGLNWNIKRILIYKHSLK